MIDLLFLQVVGGVFLLLYAIRLTGQGFELAFSSAFVARDVNAARRVIERRKEIASHCVSIARAVAQVEG
jgi:Na+/phosphate symporter